MSIDVPVSMTFIYASSHDFLHVDYRSKINLRFNLSNLEIKTPAVITIVFESVMPHFSVAV